MEKKYNPTSEELTIVREHYDGTSFQISRILRLLPRGKYPRWYIRRMAQQLGLARTKAPDWTPNEERYLLDHYPKMKLKALRAGMIRAGMAARTPIAINIKIKRLGLCSSDDDGFTLRGLCDLFWRGQDNHGILDRWIDRGWLKGKRRGTLRTKKQGGDQWYFDPEWVRAFIVKHPTEIDMRQVDPVAFITLVAGDNLDMPVQCTCPGCGKEYEKRMFNPSSLTMRKRCDVCRGSDEGADLEEYQISA
jgi:hypothetical protein